MSTEQLIGTVSSDRPLLVVAVAEEAQFLDGRLPVLITGIGKINTTQVLADWVARESGVRGTLGRPGSGGT